MFKYKLKTLWINWNQIINFEDFEDENKCNVNSKDCDENSICTPNHRGEYSCECKEGFYKLNDKCFGNQFKNKK